MREAPQAWGLMGPFVKLVSRVREASQARGFAAPFVRLVSRIEKLVTMQSRISAAELQKKDEERLRQDALTRDRMKAHMEAEGRVDALLIGSFCP